MAWLTLCLYIVTIFVALPITPVLWSTWSPYFPVSPRLLTFFTPLIPFAGCALFVLKQKGRNQPYTLLRITGLGLLAVLSLLTVIPLAETPSEAFHLLEYGLLSYLTLRAARPQTHLAYLFCFLFVLFVGSVDEGVQFFLPNRFFHIKDILLNALCGAIGQATTIFLHPPEKLVLVAKNRFLR